jgi:hypothetical protein
VSVDPAPVFVDTMPKVIPSPKPHVTKNSGEIEWYTPPEFIERARRVMGGIDCDPASSDIAQRTVRAGTYYTKETNGLDPAHLWGARVWFNPPYARGLIGRMIDELAMRLVWGEVEEAVVLTNNGTETRWGQWLLDHADATCFPSRRIAFLNPEGVPGTQALQAQMFSYFGPHVDRFAAEFADVGVILTRRRSTE